MEAWYFPLTLLPSVGFFIVAATSVANSVSAEISRLLELGRGQNMQIVSRKIRQLRLINNALVIFYLTGILFAIAGLIAGLEFNLMIDMKLLVEILVCVGIGGVVAALSTMMIYSIRAIRIKEEQFKNS